MRINFWSGHFAVAVSMLYASSSMAVITESDTIAVHRGTVRITVPLEISAPEEQSSTQASTPVAAPEEQSSTQASTPVAAPEEQATQTTAPSAVSNNNNAAPEVVEDLWTKKSKTQQGLDELNKEAYTTVAQRLNQGQIEIAGEQRKKKKGLFPKVGQLLEKGAESRFFAQALQSLSQNINSDGAVNPEEKWAMRGTLKKYNLRLIEEYNKIRFTELKEKYSK